MDLHRTMQVNSASVSALTVCTAHELINVDFIYSLQCNCTVHRSVHLQRTIHVHGASVSTLTVYTVCSLYIAECTDSIQCR